MLVSEPKLFYLQHSPAPLRDKLRYIPQTWDCVESHNHHRHILVDIQWKTQNLLSFQKGSFGEKGYATKGMHHFSVVSAFTCWSFGTSTFSTFLKWRFAVLVQRMVISVGMVIFVWAKPHDLTSLTKEKDFMDININSAICLIDTSRLAWFSLRSGQSSCTFWCKGSEYFCWCMTHLKSNSTMGMKKHCQGTQKSMPS